MFLLARSLVSRQIRWTVLRGIQYKRPTESLPKQNRKPKFDAQHFEESIRPYAEDITRENQYDKLSNMVLPLSHLSYDEQLKIKQDLVERAFDQVGNAILWDKRIDHQVLKYVEFREGQFCQVEPILRSPLIEQYRCKDDLSCGHDVDGQKTVGFYINPKNSKTSPNAVCVSPVHLKSMKPKHLLAVKHFDQFLKQHPLAVCESTGVSKKDHYWRTLTLKSNAQDHLMMIVVVHPQSLSKSELDRLKEDLVQYFVDGSGRECQIDSIYFQTCSQQRWTPEENPFELIHGKECLYETYLEKQFRITPDSFLQVNKQAAELLLQSTLKHAELDENTVLLDIGSGIGIHSIMASPAVKKVYAIDPLASSIDNGQFNAKLNHCAENIEWMGAFAEANLHRIVKKVGDLHGSSSRIVAIVNPSRYSLTHKTTAVLRSLPALERVLYILNKADEQAMHTLYGLATSDRSKVKSTDRPFIPTCVHPVDLLPHTTHADVIVKCVRV